MKATETADVELRIPRRPEFVRVARMAARAVAAQLDFTYDLIMDIELAVGEACTNSVEHVSLESCREVFTRFSAEPDRLVIEVIDHGQGFDPERPGGEGGGGLGLDVIRGVMDEVYIECGEGGGTRVRMVKYRPKG